MLKILMFTDRTLFHHVGYLLGANIIPTPILVKIVIYGGFTIGAIILIGIHFIGVWKAKRRRP